MIFNSYVKLPEGKWWLCPTQRDWDCIWSCFVRSKHLRIERIWSTRDASTFHSRVQVLQVDVFNPFRSCSTVDLPGKHQWHKRESYPPSLGCVFLRKRWIYPHENQMNTSKELCLNFEEWFDSSLKFEQYSSESKVWTLTLLNQQKLDMI